MIFSAIVFIAATASPTASPDFSASLADWIAIFSVCAALSADWRIVAVISSTEAEASCAAAACRLAPPLSWSAVRFSSFAPLSTLSALSRVRPIALRNRSIMVSIDRPKASRSDCAA